MKALIDEMENKDLMNILRENLTSSNLENIRAEFKTPAEFLEDQPIPINGLLAYGGCFSNHFY